MRKNFFNKFKEKLGEEHEIECLEKCNFSKMVDYLNEKKEKNKQRSAEEKKAEKEKKQQIDEYFGYALVDGVREKINSY